VLASVADVVSPPGETSSQTRKGKERNTIADQSLNRIFSYIKHNSKNDPLLSVIESELKYIFSRTEPLPEKSNVLHAGVTPDDAHRAIIHMYLIIGEIAKIRKGPV
jgi:hypothetical protein